MSWRPDNIGRIKEGSAWRSSGDRRNEKKVTPVCDYQGREWNRGAGWRQKIPRMLLFDGRRSGRRIRSSYASGTSYFWKAEKFMLHCSMTILQCVILVIYVVSFWLRPGTMKIFRHGFSLRLITFSGSVWYYGLSMLTGISLGEFCFRWLSADICIIGVWELELFDCVSAFYEGYPSILVHPFLSGHVLFRRSCWYHLFLRNSPPWYDLFSGVNFDHVHSLPDEYLLSCVSTIFIERFPLHFLCLIIGCCP